jgi:putative addiction module killer protein
MEPRPRIVKMYVTPGGECPFQQFFDGLEDQAVAGQVGARIARLRQGMFGDWKPLGDGVAELRIHQGPGYRIYFGTAGAYFVLLCGGKKNRQKKDIAQANRFWRDYCERKNERL